MVNYLLLLFFFFVCLTKETCFADNEDKLNDEEKAFVDDPGNADLFHDPPSNEKKRSREEQPSTSSAKRVKISANEVSSSFYRRTVYFMSLEDKLFQISQSIKRVYVHYSLDYLLRFVYPTKWSY